MTYIIFHSRFVATVYSTRKYRMLSAGGPIFNTWGPFIWANRLFQLRIFLALTVYFTGDPLEWLRVLGRITDNNNSIYFNAKNNQFDPVPLRLSPMIGLRSLTLSVQMIMYFQGNDRIHSESKDLIMSVLGSSTFSQDRIYTLYWRES